MEEWAALEETAGGLKNSYARFFLGFDSSEPSFERKVIHMQGQAKGIDLLFSTVRRMVAESKTKEDNEADESQNGEG